MIGKLSGVIDNYGEDSVVIELTLSGKSRLDLSPFSLARFAS